MRSWVLVACALATGWAFTGARAADAENFVVETTTGNEVWVQRDGHESKEPLAKGAALAANDIVVTGDSSHAVIALMDGSKVSVGPFTQYQLLKVESDRGLLQWSFRLIVGTVRALVRKLAGDNPLTRFKIHTDTGTTGVRGTEFVVAYFKEGERMDVYTLDGRVYLGPPGAEANHVDAQIIERNRSRSIGKDGKPTKHKAFNRKEFLQTLESRGFPELTLGTDLTVAAGASASGGTSGSAAKTGANGKATEAPAAAPTNGSANGGEKASLSAKLFEAAGLGNVGAVKSYLAAGADPNFRGESGSTPLMAAAKGRHTLAMKALLDAKANVNAQDNRGHTPLVYAVRWGDLEGVVLLRAVNADLSLKSADGFGAEDYAQRRGEKDIVAYLHVWRSEIEKSAQKSKRKQK